MSIPPSTWVSICEYRLNQCSMVEVMFEVAQMSWTLPLLSCNTCSQDTTTVLYTNPHNQWRTTWRGIENSGKLCEWTMMKMCYKSSVKLLPVVPLAVEKSLSLNPVSTSQICVYNTWWLLLVTSSHCTLKWLVSSRKLVAKAGTIHELSKCMAWSHRKPDWKEPDLLP